jgi:hypothetical protein
MSGTLRTISFRVFSLLSVGFTMTFPAHAAFYLSTFLSDDIVTNPAAHAATSPVC